MSETKIPVTIYSEVTPNPAVMKFVADRMLISTGEIAEYLSLEDAKGSSTLAEALFQFPFVSGIFITRNFIAITKNETIQWDMIHGEVRSYITEFLQSNETAVQVIPESKTREIETEDKSEKIEVSIEPEINTELDKTIVNLLEEYVTPAVEADGGAIHFKKFDEATGVVTVVLKGACSGCPSSTATLKGGIESLLKNHLPEVSEVVALEG
ncbi:MAG: Fe-S cluster biogenesis protein NfuA [Parvicellaceae bacterium]|jgi:Fe-S cluster biogenesis protein NfuA